MPYLLQNQDIFGYPVLSLIQPGKRITASTLSSAMQVLQLISLHPTCSEKTTCPCMYVLAYTICYNHHTQLLQNSKLLYKFHNNNKRCATTLTTSFTPPPYFPSHTWRFWYLKEAHNFLITVPVLKFYIVGLWSFLLMEWWNNHYKFHRKWLPQRT